jgi:hypothetical protein
MAGNSYRKWDIKRGRACIVALFKIQPIETQQYPSRRAPAGQFVERQFKFIVVYHPQYLDNEHPPRPRDAPCVALPLYSGVGQVPMATVMASFMIRLITGET